MDNIEQDGLKFQNDPKFDFSKFFQNKFNLAIVAMVVIAVVLVALGGWFFVASNKQSFSTNKQSFSSNKTSNDDIKIISGQDTNLPSSSQILVHVDGAVVKPGVYQLKPDARVNDAIAAAGGLAAGADGAKINLAAKLSDGQKVYVASINDPVSSGSGKNNDTGSLQQGLISINSASGTELDSLPGVGPVTAGKIIAVRPYSSLDELVSKKAVGKSEFEKIKDLVSL
jgi:competence protein ComEA